MKKLSIAIVIATYNGEKYITKQLDSIYNQTLSPNQVIVIDDHSNDDTVQIIKEYIKNRKLENWKIVEKHKNTGWQKNFKDGFDLTECDLIFPCDQDDIWHEDKIEKYRKVIDDNPKIDLLVGNFTPFYLEGATKMKHSTLKSFKYDESCELMTFNEKWFYTGRPGCVFCFRKSFYDDIRPVWNEQFPHDAQLWRMAILKGSLMLYNYSAIDFRRHNANATGKHVVTMMERKMLMKYQIQVFSELKENIYILGDIPNKKSKLEMLDADINFFNLRLRLFETRNPFIWLMMFVKYQSLYNSLKGCLADLYVLFQKGVNR